MPVSHFCLSYRWGWLLALLLALASCSLPSVPEPGPLPAIGAQSGAMRLVWERRNHNHLLVAAQASFLARHGHKLAVSDDAGRLVVYQSDDGRRVWRQRYPNLAFSTAAAGDDRQWFIGSLQGVLLAVEAGSGQEQWRTTLSSSLLAAPAVGKKVLAVLAQDGTLFGVDRSTGRRLWSVQHEPPALSLEGSARPFIVGSAVYAGFADGKVAAYRLRDGELLWERSLSAPSGHNDLERMRDIDADLLVHGDSLYVSAWPDHLMALSVHDGHTLWQRKMATVLPVAWQDNSLFLVDREQHVQALDAETGNLNWQQTAYQQRSLGAPVLQAGGLLWLADGDGLMHGLTVDHGQTAARFRASRQALADSPKGDGKRLYMLNREGVLMAWERQQ